MQTAETVSTGEYNERLVKILDSIYVKADLEQVDNNATHLNTEEITQILRILKDFEGLFGGTLGDWDTDPVQLELNTAYKTFNC